MSTGYPNAQVLAETGWLHEHLDDERTVIIDARYDLRARDNGEFEEVPGLAGYQEGHIPGAQFVDIHADLTDPQNPASIIGPAGFEALMSRLGVGPQSTVVIYDERGGVWAARLWWALRYYGHDQAKMLNGGLTAWRAAGHALSKAVEKPVPTAFTASRQEALRVGKADVLAALDDPETRIIDALPAVFYFGRAGLYPHHRKGHIPGAYNVPAEDNLVPQTLHLKPMDALEALWREAAITPRTRVITYCGGGVYASFALFVLALMGHDNAALYDASWMEWGRDHGLPVHTGRRTKSYTN